jgi:hypothetical protein
MKSINNLIVEIEDKIKNKDHYTNTDKMLIVIESNGENIYGKLRQEITVDEWEQFNYIDVMDYHYNDLYNMLSITVEPNNKSNKIFK